MLQYYLVNVKQYCTVYNNNHGKVIIIYSAVGNHSRRYQKYPAKQER